MSPPKSKPSKGAQVNLFEAAPEPSKPPPNDITPPTGPTYKRQAWALRKWWCEAQERDKGGLAKLRRVNDPLQAASLSAYQDLLKLLGRHGLSPSEAELPRWEALAALAAHARKELHVPMARALGAKREGSDTALMSELRFRRILAASDDDVEDLFHSLRRAIDQLDKASHFESLVQAVLHWNAQTRRSWSYDYYGASTPTQETDQPSNP